eukprot:597861-Pyramimonas_sp.AAC.1
MAFRRVRHCLYTFECRDCLLPSFGIGTPALGAFGPALRRRGRRKKTNGEEGDEEKAEEEDKKADDEWAYPWRGRASITLRLT